MQQCIGQIEANDRLTIVNIVTVCASRQSSAKLDFWTVEQCCSSSKQIYFSTRSPIYELE